MPNTCHLTSQNSSLINQHFPKNFQRSTFNLKQASSPFFHSAFITSLLPSTFNRPKRPVDFDTDTDTDFDFSIL